MHTVQLGGNRNAAMQVASRLRSQIAAGGTNPGELLPGVRRLALEYGLDKMTVRRSMKILESEGLVAAEPSRGYRVLRRAGPRAGGKPIAYILDMGPEAPAWGALHNETLAAFRASCNRRGQSLLVIGRAKLTAEEVVEELKSVDAGGAALDTTRQEIIDAVKEAGIPGVMVDTWQLGAGMDAVMQDGFEGGMLAVRYLADRGCRRVAWLGPLRGNVHTHDRLGGTVAGLLEAGLDLPPGMRAEADSDDCEVKARKLMARKNRPEAVIALWWNFGAAIKRAADDLGLVLGKDYELVTWSSEELYEHTCRLEFGDGPMPPVITWSIATMAETAVARIAERRANPDLAPLRVKVPTRLRLPD